MSLQDFLTWLGRPGAAVRSGLTGNVGGTVRQLAQIPLDAADAVLPGDLLPDVTRPEDAPEVSDVLRQWGAADLKPGITKSMVDIVGGIATDPLTYVPPVALAKGLGAAGRAGLGAASAIDTGAAKLAQAFGHAPPKPVARPLVDKAVDTLADTMNWGRQSDAQTGRLRGAQGARSAAMLAGTLGNEGILTGLSPKATEAAIEAIHNVTGGQATTARELVPGAYGGGWKTDADWLAEVKQVAAQHPSVTSGAVPLPEVEKAAETLLTPGVAQRKDLLDRRIWRDPTLMQHISGPGVLPESDLLAWAQDTSQGPALLPKSADIADLRALPTVKTLGSANALGMTHNPYVMLAYTQDVAKPGLESVAQLPSITQSRASNADRLAMMQVFQKGAVTDAGELLSKRTSAQADLIGKAEMMKGVIPEASAFWKTKLADAQANKARVLADPQSTVEAKAKVDAIEKAVQGTLNAVQTGDVLSTEARQGVSTWLEAAKAGPDKSLRDFAVRAEVLLKGMPQRGPIAEQLSGISREFFKKPATVGLGIPNLSFPVRNRLGMIQQAYNEASSRMGPLKAMADPAVIRAFKDAPGDLKAWWDALLGEYQSAITGKPVNAAAVGSGVDKALADIDAAFRKAGGNSSAAIADLRSVNPQAAEAVEQGVVNGFASHEELLRNLTADPSTNAARFQAFLDAPAKANEAIENRARMGTFLLHRANNATPTEAAARTFDNLLDYTTATPQNRLFRDFVPFGAFLSQTIPQVVKSPVAISTAANMLGQQPEEPVMPFMKDKVNIPVGTDELGNLQYITSLGLPVESIGQIPMSREEILPKLMGGAHPVVRTVYSALTGEDPVFGSPYMSYDKTPAFMRLAGVPEESEAGRMWNLLQSTGLTSAAAPLTRPLETLMDERLSPEEQIARLTTGVRVQSVDPARAEQAAIKELLQQNPDVKQYTSFYQTGSNPEIEQMLADLREATRKARERAKLAGAMKRNTPGV